MNRLLNISIVTLILSIILFIYSLYLAVTTESTMLKVISSLLVLYYALIIPMEISLIGKKCYCE